MKNDEKCFQKISYSRFLKEVICITLRLSLLIKCPFALKPMIKDLQQ